MLTGFRQITVTFENQFLKTSVFNCDCGITAGSTKTAGGGGESDSILFFINLLAKKGSICWRVWGSQNHSVEHLVTSDIPSFYLFSIQDSREMMNIFPECLS